MVLTLTASSNSYGPAARPEFGLDVVSTASQTCTFDVGTRHLTLLIKSGGVRVWNSADCARQIRRVVGREAEAGRSPAAADVVGPAAFLSRLPMPRAAARPGTYTVTASAGHLHSHTLVFVLR